MSYEVWNNIIDDCKTLYEYEKEKRKKLEKENERLKEEYIMLQNASDEVEEKKDKEIEILNTNFEVAKEDLARIAQLLDLEEGCTIYDIEDKIKELKGSGKE